MKNTVKASALFAMVLISDPNLSVQSTWAQDSIDPTTPKLATVRISMDEAEVVAADLKGVRHEGWVDYAVSQVSALEVYFQESGSDRFARREFGRTKESELDISLRVERPEQNESWVTRARSQISRWDQEQFNPIEKEDLFRHRTYSLSQHWKKDLLAGLSVELFLGGAQCSDRDEKETRMFLMGGVEFASKHNWGTLTARIAQDVEGSSAMSGLYGSQVERGVEFSTNITLAKFLTLALHCGMLVAKGSFQEEGVLRKAPVLTGGVGLKYQISKGISGNVEYAHRRMFRSSSLVHSATGSQGLATLTYAFN